MKVNSRSYGRDVTSASDEAVSLLFHLRDLARSVFQEVG